jgi:hypothetical protein
VRTWQSEAPEAPEALGRLTPERATQVVAVAGETAGVATAGTATAAGEEGAKSPLRSPYAGGRATYTIYMMDPALPDGGGA